MSGYWPSSLFAFLWTKTFHPGRELTKNIYIFLFSRKIFLEKNFRAPSWSSAKFYRGIKTGNLERAVSLHLARSGSQSQHGIWFILPAHGASHIIERLSIAFTANGKRQAEISRLPKTRQIYLVSAYILPVSHSYGASTKNREIS